MATRPPAPEPAAFEIFTETPLAPGSPRVRHIIREGARYHVLSWSNLGRRCSTANCEINRPRDEKG